MEKIVTKVKKEVNPVMRRAGIKAAATRLKNKLALKAKRVAAAKKAVETRRKNNALLRASFSE
jgi:hypothetical protein